MPTYQQLPSGSWRALVRLSGHQNKTKSFPTRPEAEEWGERTERELRKISLKALSEGETDSLTFAQTYALYLESPAYKNKAASTQRREKQNAAAPLRLLGKTALPHITRVFLQTNYFDVRSREKTTRGRSLAGDTIRLEKALISSVFGFAVRRGQVSNNPTLRGDFELPALSRREVRITPKQQVELQNVAIEYSRHHRANKTLIFWLAFVFSTGTRPGEAAKIKRPWCNFSSGTISIPRPQHKTRRPRIILIPQEILELMRQQDAIARYSKSEYLFFSGKPGDYRPYAYYHPWRNICARVGLPIEVVPHGVRHEFISRLFEHTSLSDSQVAALVGDVHVLSLRPYTHLRATSLRPQVEQHASHVAGLREQAWKELQAAGLVSPSLLDPGSPEEP